MRRWGMGMAAVCVAAATAGCTSTIGGTAVPAEADGTGAAVTSAAPSAGETPQRGAPAARTATVTIDDEVPAGGREFGVECHTTSDKLAANSTGSAVTLLLVVATTGEPRTENLVLSVGSMPLVGDEGSYRTVRDGATYRITGTAMGFTGNVDTGDLRSVSKRIAVAITC
ncbi:lipoprotein LpqH [Tsukamurella paurometabola]|uniref:Lipoprotein LpqH n=1 Tax=Tsukamurella paurometabola TaxID=2061 RepID=A0ABS5NDJ4_TSUPA|nr:lipoprotein LpqH [Tsukamurella paurometabola]MBS4102344.1 lipoprotein LpqH [Tsukamurella paurometabola]